MSLSIANAFKLGDLVLHTAKVSLRSVVKTGILLEKHSENTFIVLNEAGHTSAVSLASMLHSSDAWIFGPKPSSKIKGAKDPIGMSEVSRRLMLDHKICSASAMAHLRAFQSKVSGLLAAAKREDRSQLMWVHFDSLKTKKVSAQDAARYLYPLNSAKLVNTQAETLAAYKLLFSSPFFARDDNMFAVHSQDFMQIYQKCITHDKDYRAFVTKCGPCASSYAGLGKNGTGPIVIWSEFELKVIHVMKAALFQKTNFPTAAERISRQALADLGFEGGDYGVLGYKDKGLDGFERDLMVREIDQKWNSDPKGQNNLKQQSQTGDCHDSVVETLNQLPHILNGSSFEASDHFDVVLPTIEYTMDHYNVKSERRDFGVAPVFVIDAAHAQELDDGISLEETQNGDWIHVHIADVASHLSPWETLSKLAQIRNITLYEPYKCYPMLPISVAENWGIGNGRKAITFSCKLDTKGEIVDYKIGASIISNAIITGRLECDQVLQSGIPSTDSEERSIKSAEQVRLLQKLESAGKLFRMGRLQHGNWIGAQLQNLGFAIEAPTLSSNIRNLGIKQPSISSAASDLVMECMIMAGSVASKFCQKNSIPACYRGQNSVMEIINDESVSSQVKNSGLELLRKVKETAVNGFVPVWLENEAFAFLSICKVTTEPLPHFLLGILDGYVQTTSPLRRYMDLVMHYQISAFISGTPLPFTADQIVQIEKNAKEIRRARKYIEESSYRQWRREFISRHPNGLREQGWEATVIRLLPAPKSAYIVQIDKLQAPVTCYSEDGAIPELDARLRCILDVSHVDYKVGGRMVMKKLV